MFVVGSARSAHRLSSQHFAAVLSPNIAEQQFYVDRQLVTEKEISSKINIFRRRLRS